MGDIVSKNVLAERLGVSLPAVDGWVRRGCPIEKRGGRGRAAEFDMQKVTDWVHRYTTALTEKRRWGQLPATERHSIQDALRFVYLETLGSIGDAVASHDLPIKLAYAIDMQAGMVHLRAITQYCKMIGISDQFMDGPGGFERDPDWERAAEERREPYDSGLWEECWEAAVARGVRLPRNRDETDA